MTESIGLSGTGTFTQTGGMNTVSYRISTWAAIPPDREPTISARGNSPPRTRTINTVGSFTQSGGTNAISGTLALSGDYNLSGASQLSAATETLSAGALLQQTSRRDHGHHSVDRFRRRLSVFRRHAAGRRQPDEPGHLRRRRPRRPRSSAGRRPSSISPQGTLQNTGSLSVSIGANSLLLLPAGFNTATGFGSYSSLGLTHDLGTTLTVPAGTSISGSLTLNDPVICQGTLSASGGNINLNNGLIVSGNGNVSLASGSLTVNDATSGVSGGSLSLYNLYAGNGGSGTFTQSGGAIVLQNAYYDGNLYLGYNSADSGAYNLSAGKLTVANNTYVGYNGTGTFTQSGGTNTGEEFLDYLYLGYNSGSSGTYTLSESGTLSNDGEYIGVSGRGAFVQSGGTNNTGVSLGINSGGTGTYSLSGGQLSTGGGPSASPAKGSLPNRAGPTRSRAALPSADRPGPTATTR